MPATTENSVATELSPMRRDSTFSYESSPVCPLQPAEMERLRGAARELSASTEHIRTDSADSGISFACPLTLRTPGIASSAKRVRDDQSSSWILIPMTPASSQKYCTKLYTCLLLDFCRALQNQQTWTSTTETQLQVTQVLVNTHSCFWRRWCCWKRNYSQWNHSWKM